MLILGVILYIRHIVNFVNIYQIYENTSILIIGVLVYISLFIHFSEYLPNIWKHLFVIQGVVFYISYQESLKNFILILGSFYISSIVRYKIRHTIYNTCLFISKRVNGFMCALLCVYIYHRKIIIRRNPIFQANVGSSFVFAFLSRRNVAKRFSQ